MQESLLLTESIELALNNSWVLNVPAGSLAIVVVCIVVVEELVCLRVVFGDNSTKPTFPSMCPAGTVSALARFSSMCPGHAPHDEDDDSGAVPDGCLGS
jgi:hypothetical protein